MTHLHLLLAATTSTTTAKSKSSSSSLIFIVILVAFVAIYFLYLRPRQQRARAQRNTAQPLEIGTEVMTVGGIIGYVVEIDDQQVRVEVSPGVTMTFVRRAVNPRPAADIARAASSRVQDDPNDDWGREGDDETGDHDEDAYPADHETTDHETADHDTTDHETTDHEVGRLDHVDGPEDENPDPAAPDGGPTPKHPGGGTGSEDR